MKILVTGGAGFIGSHTADALLQQGYEVRIMDSLAAPVHVDGQIPPYMPAEVEFIHGDVRDRTVWEQALDGADAVFHLAAYQDYLPDFAKFFHVNAVGTALLYELIVEKKLPMRKVVVASSQATYGEGKYQCPRDGVQYPSLRPEAQLIRQQWEPRCPVCGGAMSPDWTDEVLVNPHNQYAMSKYTEEMIALKLGRRYEIPTVAMRYAITQGARQSFRNAYSGVLRIFAMRVLNGLPPVCYEDGQQLRDYVSVHDVVRANLLVMEDARANYQAFNVGGDRQVTVLEYAHLVAQRASVNLEPSIPGLYRFGDTRHIFSDVSKLKALGWAPTVSLETVVDEYLAWAQAQPGFRDYSAEAERVMRAQGTVRTVTDSEAVLRF